MGKVKKLDSSNFNEFLEETTEKLGIIDFSATWCGPCKKVHPIIDEISEEYQEEVTAGLVDVGDSPDIAQQYGVISVPQVLFFKNKERVETVFGAVSKEKYLETVKKFIS